MPEISKTHLGGTMRLGLRPTVFQPDSEWSVVRKLYGGAQVIWERHRHRYEVNPAYVERIEEKGFYFLGRDERGERMQVAELQGAAQSFPSVSLFCLLMRIPSAGHPYMVGLQAHPEFCTRPLNPSPAFLGFIASSCGVLQEQIARQADYEPPVRPRLFFSCFGLH